MTERDVVEQGRATAQVVSLLIARERILEVPRFIRPARSLEDEARRLVEALLIDLRVRVR